MGILKYIILIVLWTGAAKGAGSELSQLIEMGYEKNLSLKALEAQVSSLEASALSKSSLESPMIGFSQVEKGKSGQYLSIAQKFKFPTKYGLEEDLQLKKKDALLSQWADLKLKVRARIITLYFGIYSVQKIMALTEDELQTVKDFSRIAETKYAAGKAAMHEAMKAHVAQTQIEADLIALRQEDEALQARLRAYVNQPRTFRLGPFQEKLPLPMATGSLSDLNIKSQVIEQKKAELEASQLESELASYGYAPDFQLRYQDRIAGEELIPRSLSFEMSVPLWFWGKSSEERSATRKALAKRFEVAATIKEVESSVEELSSQVASQKSLLDIMDSALIPQAYTSFSSTLDAYKANKSSFLELLDAERSLLKVQIGYYRLLARYVENLTLLETVVGERVTDLPI